MLFSFVHRKSGIHPFVFLVFPLLLLGLIKGVALMALLLFAEACSSAAVTSTVLVVWGRFFFCDKCDGWGGGLTCCGKAPGEIPDGCKSFRSPGFFSEWSLKTQAC